MSLSLADVWLAFSLTIIGSGVAIYTVFQLYAYIRNQVRKNKKKTP